MKHVLPLAAALALTTASASAQTLFAPDFSSGSPAGYTTTTANGGTISYANGVMTTGDDSVNSTEAYVSSTVNNPSTVAYPNNTNSFNSQFTFTPSYYIPAASVSAQEQAQIYLFSLTTTNANNPILQVYLNFLGFGDNVAGVQINSGIGYGGGTQTGNGAVGVPPINSLSGETLTINITTTITLGGDAQSGYTATISDVGTLIDDSAGDYLLGTYDLTTTGSRYGSFDPIHDPLTLNVGTVGVGTNAGFIDSPASTAISDVLVQAVPEPSTYALMLSGCGLLLLAVRRRLGLPGCRA